MGEWIEALDRIAAGATARHCESQTLDFKRPTDSVQDTQHDIADAAVCFANAGGGVIVLGVLDREPGPAALVGTELDASALRRRIYEVTEPPLDVSVRELSYRDARLLEIHVRAMLQDLVARQGIVRISRQTRGTAVRYGPGPHFQRLSTSRRGSSSPRS